MKKAFSEALDTFMNTEIKKVYDNETIFQRKNSSNPYASIRLKGEFAITPLQIVVITTVICGFCIATSVATRKKKK